MALRNKGRRTFFLAYAAVFAWSVLLAACGSDAEPGPVVIRELIPLEVGDAQRELLCGRANDDVVIDAFCGRQPARIRGIEDLRALFEFEKVSNNIEQGFALNGHSTSLVARSVSAINPRVIFVRSRRDEQEAAFVAYTRGEQFSEIIVRDRIDGQLRFYLLTYRQDCNDEPEGCLPGDLLTEAAEVGWKDINVYGEEDLANTPLDCLTCHQPEGPGTPKIMRMQELEPPWNHWFYNLVPGGRALISDYLAAKGDEPLAGLSKAEIEGFSQPGMLSHALVFNNSADQPNEYVSSQIGPEVEKSAAEQGGNQPVDNSVPGSSETWEAIYERSKRGEAIAVPYHDVKVTDADKLATMSAIYTEYRQGRMSREDLPDIRNVFPDDQELLARMGFATEPDMDGEGVLMQACAQCHNDRLDQTLSRARFNVDLDSLDSAAKQRAVLRINLPDDDPRRMPPPLFRRLSDDAKRALTDLLEQ